MIPGTPTDFASLFSRVLFGGHCCFLCNNLLDKPLSVRKLPKEYKLCCWCLSDLNALVINHATYSDICHLLDIAYDNPKTDSDSIKNTFFLKLLTYACKLLKRSQFTIVELKKRIRVYFWGSK